MKVVKRYKLLYLLSVGSSWLCLGAVIPLNVVPLQGLSLGGTHSASAHPHGWGTGFPWSPFSVPSYLSNFLFVCFLLEQLTQQNKIPILLLDNIVSHIHQTG